MLPQPVRHRAADLYRRPEVIFNQGLRVAGAPTDSVNPGSWISVDARVALDAAHLTRVQAVTSRWRQDDTRGQCRGNLAQAGGAGGTGRVYVRLPVAGVGNLLDPKQIEPALRAGYERAKTEADRIRAFWA